MPKEQSKAQKKESSDSGFDRRSFLRFSATAAAATAVSPNWLAADVAWARPPHAAHREAAAYAIRHEAALRELKARTEAHPTNGDFERYANHIGSYSKGLPHDKNGVVDPPSFDKFVAALATGTMAALDSVPMGGSAKFSNPLAAYAFDLEGADPQRLGMPAPPAFASARQGAEMAELYWQSLTRDIPFTDYATDPLAKNAASDLSRFSAFTGPKAAGRVTGETLFRGASAGDLAGPYLSQFLVKDVPYGPLSMAQKMVVPAHGSDYMTDPADCSRVISGATPSGRASTSTQLYIHSARDLTQYVHKDYSFQAFLDAAQTLLSFGAGALDPHNPYAASKTQSAFATFGSPHVLDLVARVTNLALKTAWYQKWLVHLRVRPESFAMHVHCKLTDRADYPISPELLNSPVLSAVAEKTGGSYLLPMAYPEGCPLHPSYPAGHATIAGACATVLKAFFNESFVVPNPLVPSASGQTVEPYRGSALTVGGEIDKLASNIALARNAAGVHWRSDSIEGIRLGERVALAVLADFKATYPEPFSGWNLTTYDGTKVTV